MSGKAHLKPRGPNRPRVLNAISVARVRMEQSQACGRSGAGSHKLYLALREMLVALIPTVTVTVRPARQQERPSEPVTAPLQGLTEGGPLHPYTNHAHPYPEAAGMVELSSKGDTMRLRDRLFPDAALALERFGHKAFGVALLPQRQDLTNSQRLRVEAMTIRETPGALHRWWMEAPNGVTVTVLDMEILPVAGQRWPQPNIMLLKSGQRTE